MKTFANAEFGTQPEDFNLSFLNGMEIVRIGLLDTSEMDKTKAENSLAIDYRAIEKELPTENPHTFHRVVNPIRRVVINSNDLGYWFAWKGIPGEDNVDDEIRERVKNIWGELTSQRIIVVGNPRCLTFDFIDQNEKIVLKLRISEIQRMGAEIKLLLSRKLDNPLVINEKLKEIPVMPVPIMFEDFVYPEIDSEAVIKSLGKWVFDS